MSDFLVALFGGIILVLIVDTFAILICHGIH